MGRGRGGPDLYRGGGIKGGGQTVTIPGFEAELVNLVPINDARFVLGHLFTSCY